MRTIRIDIRIIDFPLNFAASAGTPFNSADESHLRRPAL
jgi:hypothetical protein